MSYSNLVVIHKSIRCVPLRKNIPPLNIKSVARKQKQKKRKEIRHQVISRHKVVTICSLIASRGSSVQPPHWSWLLGFQRHVVRWFPRLIGGRNNSHFRPEQGDLQDSLHRLEETDSSQSTSNLSITSARALFRLRCRYRSPGPCYRLWRNGC